MRRRRGVGAATGPRISSGIGELDAQAFALFLGLLGEALSEQSAPDRPLERLTPEEAVADALLEDLAVQSA